MSDEARRFPGKHTLYRSGGVGAFYKTEVRDVEVRRVPYAQWADAVHVSYVARGCRTRRGYFETSHPSTVLLPGWGHSLEQAAFTSAVVRDGVATSSSRYPSCDPRWGEEFDRLLAGYLAERKLSVALDTRGSAVKERS